MGRGGCFFPSPNQMFFVQDTMKPLSGISGAEAQQEKPVSCPELRRRVHRHAWLAGRQRSRGGQCTATRGSLGCGDEPGLVGMPCPTTCFGTVVSAAFAPTLAPKWVLSALLAPPQVSI